VSENKPSPVIDEIYASNDIVVIKSSDGRKRSVTPKEALFRAKAVVNGIAPHLPKEERDRSMDLVEGLVLAANEAKTNRDGFGYTTKLIDAIRLNAKAASDPGKFTV